MINNFILFVHRFPMKWLVLFPKEAASLIIDAQRQNLRNRGTPWYVPLLLTMFRYVNLRLNKSLISTLVRAIYFKENSASYIKKIDHRKKQLILYPKGINPISKYISLYARKESVIPYFISICLHSMKYYFIADVYPIKQ